MARQVGLFKVSGKLDDVVFYQSIDGPIVRMATSLDKKRVLSDPAFEGSRRASVVFKHATKGCGLLRRAMGALAMQVAEPRMTGKLSAKMMRVMEGDPAVMRDKRKIYNGNMSELTAFEWNSKRPLGSVLRATSTVEIDRASGVHKIGLAAFELAEGLHAPEGATHYEIFGSAAALDFDGLRFEQACASDGVRVLDGKGVGDVGLGFVLPAGSRLPIVVGLGVVFYVEGLVMKGGGCFGVVGVERGV